MSSPNSPQRRSSLYSAAASRRFRHHPQHRYNAPSISTPTPRPPPFRVPHPFPLKRVRPQCQHTPVRQQAALTAHPPNNSSTFQKFPTGMNRLPHPHCTFAKFRTPAFTIRSANVPSASTPTVRARSTSTGSSTKQNGCVPQRNLKLSRSSASSLQISPAPSLRPKHVPIHGQSRTASARPASEFHSNASSDVAGTPCDANSCALSTSSHFPSIATQTSALCSASTPPSHGRTFQTRPRRPASEIPVLSAPRASLRCPARACNLAPHTFDTLASPLRRTPAADTPRSRKAPRFRSAPPASVAPLLVRCLAATPFLYQPSPIPFAAPRAGSTVSRVCLSLDRSSSPSESFAFRASAASTSSNPARPSVLRFRPPTRLSTQIRSPPSSPALARPAFVLRPSASAGARSRLRA
jgi:hypothetical protein